MNTKNWSIQQAIKDRVAIEDRYFWALKEEKIELPKYTKPPKVPFTAGTYNLLKQLLP